MKPLVQQKSARLFVILGAFFICNALVAEFIGIKIFALEPTIGINPINWNILGVSGTLNFTTGVILWPIVFIMTDIINEYFGFKGVRFLSILAAFLIAYAFIMVFAAINVVPADFWVGMYADKGIDNAQTSFAVIFGQSNMIIIGSLVAFLVGQILDAAVFQKIRKLTGEKRFYVRATISTIISQFFDSFIVLYIAFVLPKTWTYQQLLSIGTVNYIYKVLMAILLIPALFIAHYFIDSYLGEKEAKRIRLQAAQG